LGNQRQQWMQECLQPCHRRRNAALTHQCLMMVVLGRDLAVHRKTIKGDTAVTVYMVHPEIRTLLL